MRVAVISDIHANLHALEAVFAALDAEGYDALWCLGDVVGYGPRPNRCCLSLADRADLALCGNHDLGVLGTIDLQEFSGEAAVAALWTREVLSPGAHSYLDGLAPSGRVEGADLFHGSPRDPVWDYVLSGEAALEAFELTRSPLVLVGHSHVPINVSLEGQTLTGGLAPGGTEVDLTDGRWLLNPGSVGQPRDGDPRAAFLLLDLAAGLASFRRVEYDVARTQAEIHERGLPAALGERLTGGV